MGLGVLKKKYSSCNESSKILYTFQVGGNPTRELAGDINSDPDTAEISDEQESGVLGRLWSSLSNLTGLKKRDTGRC